MKQLGVLFIILSVILSSCGMIKGHRASKSGTPVVDSESQRMFDYFYLEGLKKKEAGSYDEAFELFAHALEIDSTRTEAKFEMVDPLLRMNRTEKAYDYLKSAATQNPDNYWYNYMFANLARSLGHLDEVIAVTERLLKYHPQEAELYFLLATTYTQKEDVNKAVAAYDKMEQVIGVNENISMAKYNLYRENKNLDKAHAEIEKLISANKFDYNYLVIYGDLLLDEGDKNGAYRRYMDAYAADSTNAYLQVSLARYYEMIGDKKASSNQIRSALMNKGTDVDMKLKILTEYLKTLLVQKTELESAKPLFAVLLEQHPQEEEIHKLYADFLMASGKFKQAKEQLLTAVDLAPLKNDYWGQLMGICMRDSAYLDVVKYGERALSYLPTDNDLRMYTAVGYSQSGNYVKAVELLEDGLKMVDKTKPEMVSAYYGQMGDVYHQMNKKEKAYEQYEKALELNPRNVIVLNNYSYFLSLDKTDLDKAERMSAKAVEAEPNNGTYLDTYAWVFFQKGNYTLAKLYMQRALDKGAGDSPDVLEHYGDILYHLGEVDQALKYWKQSLQKGNNTEILKKKIHEKKYMEP